MRVIIVDSDERREYEAAMRQKSMERTRLALEKLRERVAAGKLKQPEKSAPQPSGYCSETTDTVTTRGTFTREASDILRMPRA